MNFPSLRKLPRNVWVVTVTSFLTDVSSEMIFNLLPLFLSNVLGISTSIIGLIDGLAETTASLLKGYSGWLSDKLGQRKSLTVAGYTLSALAKPFLYIAGSWWSVLAVRLVDRTGKGIRTAPRDALIADSIQPDQRGLAFGLHRAGDTAGAMTGLIIAALVVWATQQEALALDRPTFRLLILISMIPAFLAAFVLWWGAQEIPPDPTKAATTATRHRWADLNPRFRGFLFIVILFTLGNSSDSFLVLRAQERGLSILGILGMLITFNFIYSALAGPAGVLSDRLGRERLLIGGWIFYALVYAGFALSRTSTHIWILYGLYGVYYATNEGIAKAMIADLVPSVQRGTAYGFYNAAIGLSALPASLMAGILWDQVNPRAPFMMGAGLALVSVVLLLRWQQAAPVATPIAE